MALPGGPCMIAKSTALSANRTCTRQPAPKKCTQQRRSYFRPNVRVRTCTPATLCALRACLGLAASTCDVFNPVLTGTKSASSAKRGGEVPKSTSSKLAAGPSCGYEPSSFSAFLYRLYVTCQLRRSCKQLSTHVTSSGTGSQYTYVVGNFVDDERLVEVDGLVECKLWHRTAACA